MGNHTLINHEDRENRMIRDTRLTDEISLSRLPNRTVIDKYSIDQYEGSNPSHKLIFSPYVVYKVMNE